MAFLLLTFMNKEAGIVVSDPVIRQAAMRSEASADRLKRRTCPRCVSPVILEPAAKEGDVLLCPSCLQAVIIVDSGGVLELHRWSAAPPRTTVV